MGWKIDERRGRVQGLVGGKPTDSDHAIFARPCGAHACKLASCHYHLIVGPADAHL